MLCIYELTPIKHFDQKQFVSYYQNDTETSRTHLYKFISDDLEWLLSLDLCEFWSQVLGQKQFKAFVRSYLHSNFSNKKLSSDNPFECDEKRLYRLFFLVCLRLSVSKSEDTNVYLEEKLFSECIYSIWNVVDIAAFANLYYCTNEKLVSMAIQNLFSKQPKFTADFSVFLQDTLKSVDKLYENMLVKINDGHHRHYKLNADDLHYSCGFLQRAASCLRLFVDIVPNVIYPALNVNNYLNLLIIHFEKFFHLIDQVLNDVEESQIDYNNESPAVNFERSEYDFSVFLHQFLKETILDKIENESADPTSYAENAYVFFNELMQTKRIMATYDNLFSISSILLSLKKCERSNSTMSPKCVQDESTPHPVCFDSQAINCVKEVMPELSDQFIETCLKSLTTPDNVINAILEDNLPDSLRKLLHQKEQTEEIPEQNNCTEYTSTDLDRAFDNRKNIYDYDEFDIFHRSDVNTNLMHIGKRDPVVENNPLASKQKTLMLASLQKYSPVTSIPRNLNHIEYDDDFDDTVDENKLMPGGIVNEPVEESLEAETTTMTDNRSSFRPFCENPAVIRERRQERFTENKKPGRQAKKRMADKKRQFF
ncbi:hypothetical protein GJ496_002932 [Pomphorhynchus laevis]|nr:hypothetical protein GJ496_002932 [Pomphorhynchus laevis]